MGSSKVEDASRYRWRLIPSSGRRWWALAQANKQKSILVGFGVLALIPMVFQGNSLFRIELIVIYTTAAVGANLAIGYAGELFLGQAAVMAVSAYTAAILTVNYGWNGWATLVLSVLAGTICQLLLALPGLRVGGLQLGLLSFFSVLVVGSLTDLFPNLTGAEAGIAGLSILSGSSTGTYELAVAIFVLSFILIRNIVVSGWGLRLRTLRDAPNALLTLGISVRWTKVTVYVVSAIPPALAGWMLAFANEAVTASLFGLSLTLVLFAGIMIVAPGTLWGPIVGTGLLEAYSQLIGPFSPYNVLGLGIVMAVAVLVIARIRGSGARSVELVVKLLHKSDAGAPSTRINGVEPELTATEQGLATPQEKR